MSAAQSAMKAAKRPEGAKMALLTQSYVHGVSSTPLIGETIGQLLRRITAEGPERPALVACAPARNQRVAYPDGTPHWDYELRDGVPNGGGFVGSGPRKASGWAAPGLMRTTWPLLIAQ